MESKVFISHSSKDNETADAICNHLESAGIWCWIAPRDVKAGLDWTEGIIQGIEACRVFVLVFSENANISEHVRREVAKAFSLGLAVIPFRVANIMPSGSLAYFLGTVHWLDALTPPLDKHLNALTDRVKQLLANQGQPAAATRVASHDSKTESFSSTASKRIGWITGAVLAGGVIAVAFWWLDQRPPNSVGEISAKSIAVLPFENISANKDDSYFADGVQDEILNNLAKIAQLKVISRTSVMQYRADTKRDLRQIAEALGVANVLEGTVRRDGNHVRVSTELVDARNDNTIWADSYDRDLTNIFSIQSEIAQTVASRLSAQLSPEERKDIEEKPTNNLYEYDLYLQAKELLGRVSSNLVTYGIEKETFPKAISLLEEATQKDRKFALAYCFIAK